jgi:hypothetical protein
MHVLTLVAARCPSACCLLLCVCLPSRYAKRKKAKSSAYAPEPEDAGLGYEDDDAEGLSGDDDEDEQQQRPGQRKHQQQQRSAPAKQLQPSKQQQLQQRPGSSGGAKAQQGTGSNGGGSWQAALGADAPHGQYSEDVVRSLQLVDPSLIHYELIEALLLHIVTVQRQHGPAGLLKVGWGLPAGHGSEQRPAGGSCRKRHKSGNHQMLYALVQIARASVTLLRLSACDLLACPLCACCPPALCACCPCAGPRAPVVFASALHRVRHQSH